MEHTYNNIFQSLLFTYLNLINWVEVINQVLVFPCSQFFQNWKKFDLMSHDLWVYPVAQSICTNYFSLSGQPDIFLESGKIRSKYGPEKSREQKTGSLLFKKRRMQLPLLFLNNNDLVFCTLLFAPLILDPDF